jgi:hypothetical protein
MKSAIIAILLPVSAGLSVLGPGTALARPPSRRDLLEHDVGVAAWLLPDTVDSGTVIAPRVVVRNYGLYTETFQVHLRIPGFYEAGQVVTLGACLCDTIPFPAWVAQFWPPDRYVMAWTLLEGDENPANDTLTDTVIVRGRHLELLEVLWPRDTVPDDTLVYARAVVGNFGTTTETFRLLFEIGLFSSRETVVDMPGRTIDTIESSVGWLSSPGIWLLRVELIPDTADPNPGNNVMYDTFWVPGNIRHDVGVVSINSPAGSIDTTGMLDVTAMVRNFGAKTETFWTYFSIFDPTDTLVYYDSVKTESLAPGSSAELTFSQADINVEGYYIARCSTHLADDQNWTNNLVAEMFQLQHGPWFPQGWFEVVQMPIAPSGRPVKCGGWATADEGNNLIYVAKGYKTNDFYSYAPAPPNEGGGTWTTLCGMPYETHPLWGNKPPGRGAKGATDNDNRVYVTQGNNSLGWWVYDVAEDTWFILTDVPLGPFDNKVKGGTDLVYVPGEDTSYVYCLKGYKTEFYRYNVVSDNWQTLDGAPIGQRNKWDKGSWLVWDGDRYLYAHKAKYHELHRFDLESQKWDSTSLTGMPFSGIMGRKKKSKDGGSAACFDGFIRALKGGNTQEWWEYDVAADTWTERETMPAFGSTGRKKGVKYGADVVHWGGSAPVFFTAKGNKTVEFWGYQEEPPAAFSGKPSRSGVAGSAMPTGRCSFDVMPNPFRTRASMRFALQEPSRVDLAVYSSDGRRVRILACGRLDAGRYEVVWDGCGEAGRPVARSVYYLRFVAGDYVQQKKLVKTE